jgi:hypothetical protein
VRYTLQHRTKVNPNFSSLLVIYILFLCQVAVAGDFSSQIIGSKISYLRRSSPSVVLYYCDGPTSCTESKTSDIYLHFSKMEKAINRSCSEGAIEAKEIVGKVRAEYKRAEFFVFAEIARKHCFYSVVIVDQKGQKLSKIFDGVPSEETVSDLAAQLFPK